jgi:predicted lysophospholipase L1 biosynthesis ABC-type transport system permease subunit
MPYGHRVFVAVSLIIVALMYVVPFYGLTGVVGPDTLLFWVLISAVYLAIVVFVMRGDG